MGHLSIGNRMKDNYEHRFKFKLPLRMPVLIRIDGKAFHTFTKGFKEPFDENLMKVMDYTAYFLCQEIQTTVCAYLQSDEISLLLHNYKKLTSDAWFDNNIQKMVSISASLATYHFNKWFQKIFRENGAITEYNNPAHILDRYALFDARVWVLPEKEVCNYFIFRQLDWQRNSLSMLARSLYSQKELNGKKREDLHNMIYEKGENWNDLPIPMKRGRCVIKKDGEWVVDNEIPDFTKERNYIERFLTTEE